MAAIIPASVGQDFFGGARIGAAWGLGHGITASIIGMFAFFLKGKVSTRFKFIEKLSGLSDSAVGISLLVIGLIGIKESLATTDVEKVEDVEDGSIYYTSPTGLISLLGSFFYLPLSPVCSHSIIHTHQLHVFIV